MKKLMNTICYVLILLLVILDITVLTYFFHFWTAPVRYYICLGCIAAAIILLLIFQIKLKKRLNLYPKHNTYWIYSADSPSQQYFSLYRSKRYSGNEKTCTGYCKSN